MAVPRVRPVPGVTSSEPSTSILALVNDASSRARLIGAMRGRANVECVARVSDALAHLRRDAEPPAAIVLEPVDGGGMDVSNFARRVRAEFPTVALIGYCPVPLPDGRSILELARAGVHELVFQGNGDTSYLLRHAVATATRSCAADHALALLAQHVPPRILPLLRCSLYHPNMVTVFGVAEALSIHRKTLFMHCAAAHLPPPGIVIGWCRLMLAGALLGTTVRPVESIAHDLGFPSVAAFRNMLKRYTNLRPAELRGSGRLTIARMFIDQLTSRVESETTVS